MRRIEEFKGQTREVTYDAEQQRFASVRVEHPFVTYARSLCTVRGPDVEHMDEAMIERRGLRLARVNGHGVDHVPAKEKAFTPAASPTSRGPVPQSRSMEYQSPVLHHKPAPR
jgi:hypothetical protein